MVDFIALADALEVLGWFAIKRRNIEWDFIKQQTPGTGFRTITVMVDGRVYLSANHNRHPCPFRVESDEWDVLNVVERFTRDVEI